jgi:hypothetical protein
MEYWDVEKYGPLFLITGKPLNALSAAMHRIEVYPHVLTYCTLQGAMNTACI